MTTVVELVEVAVEPPLVDGAVAHKGTIGIFDSADAASQWLADRADAMSVHGAGYAVLCYVGVETVVDGRRAVARYVVLDIDGTIRGTVPCGDRGPWRGRRACECRYVPGEPVGFVHHGLYRVGVVVDRPPSPGEALRRRVRVGADVYRVELLDGAGGAEGGEHECVPECLLWRVEERVATSYASEGQT